MKTFMMWALFSSFGVVTLTATDSRPNVLIIFADDMRADSVGALGNPAIKTPNLDRLVDRGLVFNRAYCLGGNIPAVCVPSRNMLLSGRSYFRWSTFVPSTPEEKAALGKFTWPYTPGMLAPGNIPNIADSFKAAGYQTYHRGKEGASALILQSRFEINEYIDAQKDRTSGEPGKMVADGAVRFLRERSAERPFLMYLGFANPHDAEGNTEVRRFANPPYMAEYDRLAVPLPQNFLPQHPFDNGAMMTRDEQVLPWPRPADVVQRHLHEYSAVVTAMDGYIGRILSVLREQGQLDNTLVIFTADQGIAIGSHGLLGKQNLYEDGMRVPFVIAGPGIKPGRTDAMIYLLDLYPTLCDRLGIAVPEGLDGQSFAPVIRDPRVMARHSIFLSYAKSQRSWQDKRWKIVRYPQVDVTQLFDLKTDPAERYDLAEQPEQAARIVSLMQSLQQAQSQFGDDLPLKMQKTRSREWTPPSSTAVND